MFYGKVGETLWLKRWWPARYRALANTKAELTSSASARDARENEETITSSYKQLAVAAGGLSIRGY